MKMALKNLFFGSTPANTTLTEIAYALFRFYCGISMAVGAGLAKVFHKIDEKGGDDWANLAFGIPDWFVKQVGEIGFTFITPSFWATLAVYGEFIGGLLIAFGLLTRFSALQMAFQFFVVAFVWYDAPMPFVMYYQQWIFWSFVLIAAFGSGRYSLDNWLIVKRFSVGKTLKTATAIGALLLCSAPIFAQKNIESNPRVSFTISNPTLKMREVNIRYFDQQAFEPRGYGYDLGALQSHAVNMPVGTRVYQVEPKGAELILVITAADQGRTFDLTQQYPISAAQRAQVAEDEYNEEMVRNTKSVETPDLATMARSKGYEMVDFRVTGKSIFPRQVRVRAQLPFEAERSNVGFSQRLSSHSELQVSYPVGTKIYLCDGEYWSGLVPETLFFTVESTLANDLIRI